MRALHILIEVLFSSVSFAFLILWMLWSLYRSAYMMAISLTCKLDVLYKMYLYYICSVSYTFWDINESMCKISSAHYTKGSKFCTRDELCWLQHRAPRCLIVVSTPNCTYIEVDRNCKFIRFVWVRDDLVVCLVIIPIHRYGDEWANRPCCPAENANCDVKSFTNQLWMYVKVHSIMMRHGAMRVQPSFTPY